MAFYNLKWKFFVSIVSFCFNDVKYFILVYRLLLVYYDLF